MQTRAAAHIPIPCSSAYFSKNSLCLGDALNERSSLSNRDPIDMGFKRIASLINLFVIDLAIYSTEY